MKRIVADRRPVLVRRPFAVALLCAMLAPAFEMPVSAADNFPDYPVRPLAEYSVKAEQPNIAIGLEPVETAKEQETYFHTKLAPKGFLPVFIVLTNTSASSTFVFDKSKITLGDASSAETMPMVHSKAGEITAVASVAAISMVGAIVAIKLMANATNVQQNILKRELQSKTLSPGQSTHGFLYLQMPKNGERGRIRLRVPVIQAGTTDSTVLDLVF